MTNPDLPTAVRALRDKWRKEYAEALAYDKQHGLRDTTVELGGKAIAADDLDALLAHVSPGALIDSAAKEERAESAEWVCPFDQRACDDTHNIDASAASAASPGAETPPQDGLINLAHQVYFRAGLIACREYMARFVEAESPSIAMSIRANWWPSLGQDYGPPRQLDWSEVTHGEYGAESFRVRTIEEVSPTLEALPVALGFLQAPHCTASHQTPPRAQDGTSRARSYDIAQIDAEFGRHPKE